MLHHIRDYRKFASGENSTPAVIAALSTMNDGDTLSLDGQTLHLYPEGAHTAFYAISNNAAGEKPIAFPLIGRRNITVDGDGARLVFHTRILPFAIDRSEAVTIRNLTVDYSSPYYAQPKITEADETRTVLQFDSPECGCRVKNGHFCFYSRVDGWEEECETALSLEFSPTLTPGQPLPHPTHAAAVPSACKPPYFPYCGEEKDHGFLGGMYRDVTLTERSPDVIEMRGNLGFVHTPGAYLVMTHATREFPGIFITDAKDVTLENICLTYTSSMGVIAQTSENLTLDRITAEVEAGSQRILSVNADATHFVNCRGRIDMKHCKFTNMMDDACNIHGIYGIIRSAENRVLTVGFGHFQQEGINFLRAGDTVAVIDRRKTETVCTRTVVSSELVSMKELRVTLSDTVSAEPDGLDFASGDYLLENLSTAPTVTIQNCECGYNRPRGFLISTSGKTVVDRCTFYNMNTAVQIGGELLDWYESGAVNDVTIQNCHFDNSAYAGGVSVHIEPRLAGLPDTPFHGRIAVENNRFTQCHPRMMRAVSVKELVFRGNTFVQDETLPAHPAHGKNGISVQGCGDVLAEVKSES